MKIKKQKPQVNLFVEQIAKATKKYSKENGIGNMVKESSDDTLDDITVYVVRHKDSGDFVGVDGQLYGVGSVLQQDDVVVFDSIEDIESEIESDDDTGIDEFHGYSMNDDVEIGRINISVDYAPV